MDSHFFLYLTAALVILTLISQLGRKAILRRSVADWLLDASSLLNHFFILPALQMLLILPLYAWLIPSLKGSVDIGWGVAILANMLIDYGWYWNHRFFHARTRFWSLHAVHHEPEELDIFKTPRNTFWSPFFMVYFWFIPFFIFIAVDPAPMLFVAGFSLFINFWGHTHLNLPLPLRKICSVIFIQPKDHYWHHSKEQTYCNFGTVYNFWDRLHGTWYEELEAPKQLGFALKYSLARKILWPI